MTSQTGILRRKIYHNKEWNKFLRGNASSPKVGRPQGLRCSRSFRPIAGPTYQPGATRMMTNKKRSMAGRTFPVRGRFRTVVERSGGLESCYAAKLLCTIIRVPSGAAIMTVRQFPSLMVITFLSYERSHTRCLFRFLMISVPMTCSPFSRIMKAA